MWLTHCPFSLYGAILEITMKKFGDFLNRRKTMTTDNNEQEPLLNEEAINENAPDSATADSGPAEETAQDASQAENTRYAELHDKYMRLFADFENFRKRTMREKVELISNANEKLISNLLPIVDDFERAKRSFENDKNIEQLMEGMDLIISKFVKTLTDEGLKPIESINQSFDPELHDAITKIPAPSAELKGKVVDEIQKGYYLNDKIIRHSKVVVGE